MTNSHQSPEGRAELRRVFVRIKANNLTATDAADLAGIKRSAVLNYWRNHPEMKPAWKVKAEAISAAQAAAKTAPQRKARTIYSAPVTQRHFSAAEACSTASSRTMAVTLPAAPWEAAWTPASVSHGGGGA